MNHDFESDTWANNHGELGEAVARLIDKVAYAFERLAAIEYDAPWERR